jgi:polar amino acid transport system substrate-binding protein
LNDWSYGCIANLLASDSGIVLVVKKDSPIHMVADLNKPEYTVAHLTAPVQEERGRRLYPNAKFLTFDAISSQFNAVKLGRATAAGDRIDAGNLRHPL